MGKSLYYKWIGPADIRGCRNPSQRHFCKAWDVKQARNVDIFVVHRRKIKRLSFSALWLSGSVPFSLSNVYTPSCLPRSLIVRQAGCIFVDLLRMYLPDWRPAQLSAYQAAGLPKRPPARPPSLLPACLPALLAGWLAGCLLTCLPKVSISLIVWQVELAARGASQIRIRCANHSTAKFSRMKSFAFDSVPLLFLSSYKKTMLDFLQFHVSSFIREKK